VLLLTDCCSLPLLLSRPAGSCQMRSVSSKLMLSKRPLQQQQQEQQQQRNKAVHAFTTCSQTMLLD
jgi:hypothetical protein